MSFYTDEQLSLILSASEGALYWAKLGGTPEDPSWNEYRKGTRIQERARKEWGKAHDFCTSLGFDDDIFPDPLLRQLEKAGLA